MSIKQTQESFFEKRFMGCDPSTGVGLPNFLKVAKAFELPTKKIDSHKDMKEKISSVLNTKGPLVCEVKLVDGYKFSPKLSSEKRPDGKIISKPLEDMFPFLDREEFKNNMLIPICEE